MPPGFRPTSSFAPWSGTRVPVSEEPSDGATALRVHTVPRGPIRRLAVVALPPVRDSLPPAVPWRRGRCLRQEPLRAGTLPGPRRMKVKRSITRMSSKNKTTRPVPYAGGLPQALIELLYKLQHNVREFRSPSRRRLLAPRAGSRLLDASPRPVEQITEDVGTVITNQREFCTDSATDLLRDVL